MTIETQLPAVVSEPSSQLTLQWSHISEPRQNWQKPPLLSLKQICFARNKGKPFKCSHLSVSKTITKNIAPVELSEADVESVRSDRRNCMDFARHCFLIRNNKRLISCSSIGNSTSHKEIRYLENLELTLCFKKTGCPDNNHC